MKINVDLIWPIGSIYISVSSTNPSKYFGGTWVQFAQGRTLVGVDTVAGDPDLTIPLKTGGEYWHTLTINEMPSHFHDGIKEYFSGKQISSRGDGGGGWLSIDIFSITGSQNNAYTHLQTVNTGGGQSHNNMQPYITVYMWRRTA